eukprot:TRINITY_DN7348_c1_g1_i1.p1 TRINITY_DN7348_c1_g1~~TRINITY_DN7348_c1_g1_i1.p1  ORF type:complete len:798 (+),score=226.59 TRINITY_DN7348_c1_g1_i1:271-2394(+)
MQEKLKHGVRYNMKIILKGPRGSGKSTLLKRLQGKPYEPTYQKTPQLHAATIHWRSRQAHAAAAQNTEEPGIIKLEVWDVVDQGFATPAMRTRHEQMVKKLASSGATSYAVPELQISDSTTIDVYRGAHAVVIVLDATRRSDLDYLRSELLALPKDVCVLVCRNKCDRVGELEISEEDIHQLVAEIPPVVTTPLALKAAQGQASKVDPDMTVRPICISASMENCYGLKQMYNYFNVPFEFLRLQALEDEIKQKWRDLHKIHEGVEEDSSESYTDFCKWLGSDARAEEEADSESGAEPKVQPVDPPALPDDALGTNVQQNFTEKLRREAVQEVASLKTQAAPTSTPKEGELHIEKYTGSFTGGDEAVKGFFDDVSDSGSDKGASTRQKKPPSDIDSDDLTAAQLAFRAKHQTKKSKKGKPAKQKIDSSDEADTAPEPELTAEQKAERDAADAAAAAAAEQQRAEEEERKRKEREAAREAARQERKRRAAEDKRLREQKEEDDRREQEEWRARERAAKENKAREAARIQEELGALADEVADELDKGFYSDDSDKPASPRAAAPAAADAEQAADSADTLQDDEGFIRVPPHKQEADAVEDTDMRPPTVDYGLPHIMDVAEEEAPPAVSSDALKALELAMQSFAAESPEKAEESGRKPKKEKKEKEAKTKKERKDKKEKEKDREKKKAKKEKKAKAEKEAKSQQESDDDEE